MKPKFEDVELEIRKLAREFPDRKAGCTYLRDGEPMCIFGHALYRLGESIDRLTVADAGAYGTSASEFIYSLDLAALRWANTVQGAQDDGMPWARAVDYADWLAAR